MVRKTRSYLSNSEYQTRMLHIFAGISLVQGGFFAMVGYGLINNLEKLATQSGLDSNHPFFQLLHRESTYLHLMILGGVLTSSILFIWIGMKYSHDAVGAIYHLKKDMEEMTKTKKMFQVKLRRNDYFKEFESSFNKLVTTFAPHTDQSSDQVSKEQTGPQKLSS